MYLPRILLLVPMLLATGRSVRIDNYDVEFTSDFEKIVESIKVIGDPSEDLNLSDMNIEDIKDNAFENVSHIKVLDLSYNLLSDLRDTQFASLTNLEHLSLSDNTISKMKKPFAHLSNLKLLDLSNTHIRQLNATDFFGLTESCVILLQGNNILTISTEVFKYESHSTYDFYRKRHSPKSLIPSKSTVKICIENAILISVDHFTEAENFSSHCSTDRYYEDGILRLNLLSITGFQEDWYKLQDSSINHIDLSSNEISRLTSTILNNLPESITSVDLAINHFERLEKSVIVNPYVQKISFQNNLIVEIEDDVFINTRLTTLILSYNQLNNTKFATTLPSTLTKIELKWNSISDILRDSFWKLNNLKVLQLDRNFIKEIRRGSFRGLSSLKSLTLNTNEIEEIEEGSFEGLTNLYFLHLKSNFITELDSGIFHDLQNIKYISIYGNKLSYLTRDSFIDWSSSLEVLDLQHNVVGDLKTDTFINFPKYELLLTNNNISNIEYGSFDLPHLQYLNLMQNSLSVIDSEMFEDLKNLRHLRLYMNNITKIEKGAFRNSPKLCILDLSKNPIKRLERGSLHGLLQNKGCRVGLKDVPIEIIYGGVFAGNVDSSVDLLSVNNNNVSVNF